MVRVGAYTRHTREISQISAANKYCKAPNSDKAREVPLTLPPSSLQQLLKIRTVGQRNSWPWLPDTCSGDMTLRMRDGHTTGLG